MPTTKVYRAHCDGFSLLTADLGAMQAWIDARKQDCRGKVLSLLQGVGSVSRTGTVTGVFAPGCPSREVTL